MINPLEQIRELVNNWQKSRNFSGGDLAHSILAILNASQGYVCVPVGEVECRLWDTQWMNIVNHENCYRYFDKESAIADAVRRTEDAMARNFRDGKWPPHKAMLAASKETNRE